MVDVFLSYSRHDEAAVRRLAQKIEAEGYEVWWDAELPPHKSYGEVIEEKVASAKAAVVVWSPTAAKSEWVRAEADMARNQRKLIQTALGDIMPPLPFNQIQFADIGDWQGEDDHTGWRKVKASLSELCGARKGAEPGASIAMAATTPPPPPAPETSHAPEPIVAAEPLKWPLFVGIGIALLALVGVGAFVMGQMGGGSGDRGATVPAIESPTPEPSEPAQEEIPEPETEPTPVPSQAPPPSASRGRIVGCYFWNSVHEYDGSCRFVAGQDGDFTTFAMDGNYFEGVARIDLDVVTPGAGYLEVHYPDGAVQRTKVRRSANDRACWDGPRLTFCAR